MIFKKTRIQGVYLLELERVADERGFFARLWCQTEFEKHGIDPRLVQCNLSFNPHQGTLRGMHYQLSPHEETKVVRCTMGAIFDVAVDLRRDSSDIPAMDWRASYCGKREMLVIPPGLRTWIPDAGEKHGGQLPNVLVLRTSTWRGRPLE